MRRVAVAIAVIVAGLGGVARAASPLAVVSSGLAVKMATEQLVVHSAALNRDVIIEVTRPFTPPMTPTQRFPAVYALDGGYEFAGLEGWLLGGAGGMASAYTIAVGYKPADYGKRDADLTSLPVTRNGHSEPGRAALYRTFLIDELKPFIEARYPLDPGRAVLVGHSFGGSFALALLADRPGVFAGYLVGSPGIWNEPDLASRIETAKGQGQRVFIAMGGKEDARLTDGVTKLATALSHNQSLKVRSEVFPDATHVAYYPELIARGLAYVLPPPVP
jgi:predicted alpha/beta superfamily hydrolase